MMETSNSQFSCVTSLAVDDIRRQADIIKISMEFSELCELNIAKYHQISQASIYTTHDAAFIRNLQTENRA